MKRINITLTDEQHEAMQEIAERTEINISERIRRLVDEYLLKIGYKRKGEEVPSDE